MSRWNPLCGRMMEVAGDTPALVCATALSQQLTRETPAASRSTVPSNSQRLFALAWASQEKPVAAQLAAEEFHLDFKSEQAAKAAEQRLKALRYAEGR